MSPLVIMPDIPKADIRRREWHVRFGSKKTHGSAIRDVRFTPDSGHLQRTSQCPLCAIADIGEMTCAKKKELGRLLRELAASS